jgi:acetyl-CoA C-acetyltransferase
MCPPRSQSTAVRRSRASSARFARAVAPNTAGRLVVVETAVILEGARTPIGRFLGSFADTPAVELGTLAAEEAMRRAGVEADTIDQTIYGHARQAGNGPNTGRQVSVRAGVPLDVSAYNVNIACGSGMKAVQLAAQQIALGDSEVVLAGGMENMTRVPYLLPDARRGHRLGDTHLVDAMYRDGLLDPLCGLVMGETAENLVDMYDLTRDEQDAFAVESQRKAAAGADRRAAEMFPVEATAGRATVSVTTDEHPRPETTMEGLAKLAPVFREGGSVTAGNSSGITDGAAAMVVMAESRAEAEGRRPLARILAWSWAGVPPEIMGIGPVPATKKVLERTGLAIDDFDRIEINEAFAAQVIACERELKFDRDRLNVNGGGISLGHPIGMSGARIILSLAYELRASGGTLGLATLCISGGQGLAVVLERA